MQLQTNLKYYDDRRTFVRCLAEDLHNRNLISRQGVSTRFLLPNRTNYRGRSPLIASALDLEPAPPQPIGCHIEESCTTKQQWSEVKKMNRRLLEPILMSEADPSRGSESAGCAERVLADSESGSDLELHTKVRANIEKRNEEYVSEEFDSRMNPFEGRDPTNKAKNPLRDIGGPMTRFKTKMMNSSNHYDDWWAFYGLYAFLVGHIEIHVMS
ncbi:hypothetical protein CR513_13678, partial [Mucuna pruriens]